LLHFHHHAVLPEGVFVEVEGKVLFEKLERPQRSDLEAILERVASKTLAMVRRRGLLDEEPPSDALAGMRLEAVQSGLPLPLWPSSPKGLSAFLEGFSLEAGSHVHENDRAALEHLCRYGLRPPLALSRLSWASDGRVLLRLKRPMYDGTREVAFTPLQLLGRLAALVPPPRWHQTRYFGVFGPGAWWRKRIVPKAKPSPGPAAAPPALAEPRPPYRLPWSLLLARTFAVDILRCHCGGERKLLAVVSEPRAAQEALKSLGLPSTEVEVSPASWPTQDELNLPRDYGGADPPFFDEVA
jgi:hypothetical protein